MKKMLLVMAASALVAANIASAQSETVTSVNVVGYYNVTIPDGQMAFVTPVLEPFGDSLTIGELLGASLPVGSTAYVWDRTYPKGYKTYNYFSVFGGGGVWKDSQNNEATNQLYRGDAIWLKPPAGSGEITVTMMGQVPGEYTGHTNTVVSGLDATDAVGYTYPIDILWPETEIAKNEHVRTVHFWNGLGYETFNKFDVFGGGYKWDDGVTNRLVKAGEAFWVEVDTPTFVTDPVPYDL